MSMHRYLKIILISFCVIFILPIVGVFGGIAGYNAWLGVHYYLASDSFDAAEISAIAIEKNDPSVCGKIKREFYIPLAPAHIPSDEELQSYCYSALARSLRDTAFCQQVDNLYKEECYEGVAEGQTQALIRTHDINACGRGLTQDSKDACYLELNKTLGDLAVCDEKIQSSEQKDSCYQGVIDFHLLEGRGLTPQDRLLCQRIREVRMRERCLDDYDSRMDSYERNPIYNPDGTRF